jgi:hypothetical protein
MILESFPVSNNRLEEIRREQHVLQFLTTSSSCLLIPSHQTVFLARSRHFTIPWCASCNLLRMSVDIIMESFPVSNNRHEELRREQASDPIIRELSRLCREGWTKN